MSSRLVGSTNFYKSFSIFSNINKYTGMIVRGVKWFFTKISIHFKSLNLNCKKVKYESKELEIRFRILFTYSWLQSRQHLGIASLIFKKFITINHFLLDLEKRKSFAVKNDIKDLKIKLICVWAYVHFSRIFITCYRWFNLRL